MTPLRKRQARKERDLLNETRVQRKRIARLEKELQWAVDILYTFELRGDLERDDQKQASKILTRWRRVLEAR